MKQSNTFALVGVSVGIGLGVLTIDLGSDSKAFESGVPAMAPPTPPKTQVQLSQRMSNDELQDTLLTLLSNRQDGKVSFIQLQNVGQIAESVRGREEEYFSLVMRIYRSNGGISLNQLLFLADLRLDLPRLESPIQTSVPSGSLENQFSSSVNVPTPSDYGQSSRAWFRNELRTTTHRDYQAEYPQLSGTYLAENPEPSVESPGRSGAFNPSTGEFYPASGPGYVNGRDGTYYAQAGPNGAVNTRTGQIVIVAP